MSINPLNLPAIVFCTTDLKTKTKRGSRRRFICLVISRHLCSVAGRYQTNALSCPDLFSGIASYYEEFIHIDLFSGIASYYEEFIHFDLFPGIASHYEEFIHFDLFQELRLTMKSLWKRCTARRTRSVQSGRSDMQDMT